MKLNLAPRNLLTALAVLVLAPAAFWVVVALLAAGGDAAPYLERVTGQTCLSRNGPHMLLLCDDGKIDNDESHTPILLGDIETIGSCGELVYGYWSPDSAAYFHSSEAPVAGYFIFDAANIPEWRRGLTVGLTEAEMRARLPVGCEDPETISR